HDTCSASPPNHRARVTAPAGSELPWTGRLSLWERPRAARVRVAYEHEGFSLHATLTPTLSQREREIGLLSQQVDVDPQQAWTSRVELLEGAPAQVHDAT